MTTPVKPPQKNRNPLRNRVRVRRQKQNGSFSCAPVLIINLPVRVCGCLFVVICLFYQFVWFTLSRDLSVFHINNNSNIIKGTEEYNMHGLGDRFDGVRAGSSHLSVYPTSSTEELEDLALLEPFSFLVDLLPTQQYDQQIIGSDVVDLSYCDLTQMDWLNFTGWFHNAVDSKFQELKQHTEKQQSKEKEKSTVRLMVNADWKVAHQECVLQMIEIYANFKGLCDYSRFRPTVPRHLFQKEAKTLQQLVPVAVGSKRATSPRLQVVAESNPQQLHQKTYARLAIIIVAYKDSNHLVRILEAVHMPHHYIVIHIERRTSLVYETSVNEIASKYDNVIVLKFGTITYQTDSVTMVNLQIMQWLTFELNLDYDYLLTLGGAVFPLQSAQDLASHLEKSSRRVLLGELTHAGHFVDSPQTQVLIPRRLRLTIGDIPKLIVPRLQTHNIKYEGLLNVDKVLANISRAMTRKTNSGNQAIFSRGTVQKLLTSSHSMEVFALSKYGCCCCIEERNWIAAISLINNGKDDDEYAYDYQKEALQYASMFQTWDNGMRNAILYTADTPSSNNNSIPGSNIDDNNNLFRIEDASHGIERDGKKNLNIMDSEVMAYLKDAKKRGLLFCRKFSSDHPRSMALLQRIRDELH